MHIDLGAYSIDDIISGLDKFIESMGRMDDDTKRPHDAILDACRRYCREHDCKSCGVGKMIDDHHTEDDYCIICSIACCEQPVEAMLAEVMRYGREGDPKPKSYIEDYFSKFPEAERSAIEKNGIKMPAVCRVAVYKEGTACPGGKTCWECWQEKMED